MNYYYIKYEIKDYSRKISNKQREMFVKSSYSLTSILSDPTQTIRFIKDYSYENYIDRGDYCVFINNIKEIKKEVFGSQYNNYQISKQINSYLSKLKSDLYIPPIFEKDNGYRFIFIQ